MNVRLQSASLIFAVMLAGPQTALRVLSLAESRIPS